MTTPTMTTTLPEEEFAALVGEHGLTFLHRVIRFADHMAGEGWGHPDIQDEHGHSLGMDEVCYDFLKASGWDGDADPTPDEYIHLLFSRHSGDAYTDTINAVREAAKAVTGGSCDFADDDVERLRALAMEAEGLRAERDALRAALTDALDWCPTCRERGGASATVHISHPNGDYTEECECATARQALAGKGGES